MSRRAHWVLNKVQTRGRKGCERGTTRNFLYSFPLSGTRSSSHIGRGPSDLFSRRFREGISFPNFLERSILKLPLSKLCAVPFALQNRALFEGEIRAKRCPEKGRKMGGQQRGKKEKRTRENRSVIGNFSCRFRAIREFGGCSRQSGLQVSE